jgi:hypothetical protein
VASLAAAVPGCILVAWSLVSVAMAAFGQPPMWPHEAYTLAEAAGARDEAEVVRLIERGEDPNGRYSVRAGLVLERTARLTPLEAAVLNDDPAITRELLARGATLNDTAWPALRCHAGLRAAAVLDQAHPPGRLDCGGMQPPWD